MDDLDKLETLLSEIGELLVDSTVIIRDVELGDYRKNIYRAGIAIAKISEIKTELYKVRPDLKPELWDKSPSEAQYEEMFVTAVEMADEYLESNNFERAIETLEAFKFIGPCTSVELKVNQKIREVKTRHDV